MDDLDLDLSPLSLSLCHSLILSEGATLAAAVGLWAMAKRVDKQVNLFYCAECEELARKVADHSDAIQLRTISWR